MKGNYSRIKMDHPNFLEKEEVTTKKKSATFTLTFG